MNALTETTTPKTVTRYSRLHGEARALADHILASEGAEAVESVLDAHEQEQERLRQEQHKLWDDERQQTLAVRKAEWNARPGGEGWTPFRPFVNKSEQCGAMKCCQVIRAGKRTGKPCNNPSEYVSYGFGRIALCAECYAEHQARETAATE